MLVKDLTMIVSLFMRSVNVSIKVFNVVSIKISCASLKPKNVIMQSKSKKGVFITGNIIRGLINVQFGP